jgi:hypothetical protein
MAAYSPSAFSKIASLHGATQALTNAGLSDALDLRDIDNTSFTELDVSQFERFSVQVICVSDTLAAFTLEHSFDLVNWVVVDSTTFVGLTVGTSKTLENSDNSRPYFRARGQSTGASGSVRVIVQGYLAQ